MSGLMTEIRSFLCYRNFLDFTEKLIKKLKPISTQKQFNRYLIPYLL